MPQRPGKSRVRRSKTAERRDTGEKENEHLDDRARRLVWAIAAVSARLEDLRYFWAEALGVSGPQWMILMTVNESKASAGIPVREIAKKLEVDPSFVASQSKRLEEIGFLARSTSKDDSRVVLLALTALAQKQFSILALRQSALNEFVYEDLSPLDVEDIVSKLMILSKRLERAALRLESEA